MLTLESFRVCVPASVGSGSSTSRCGGSKEPPLADTLLTGGQARGLKVVKQGERGHKFYIVLAGAVSVFVHKAKDSVETPKHQLPSGTPRASTIGVGDLVWRYGVGNAKPMCTSVCVQPHAQRWLMVPLSVWLVLLQATALVSWP